MKVKLCRTKVRDFLHSRSRNVIGQLKTFEPTGSYRVVYTYLCLWQYYECTHTKLSLSCSASCISCFSCISVGRQSSIAQLTNLSNWDCRDDNMPSRWLSFPFRHVRTKAKNGWWFSRDMLKQKENTWVDFTFTIFNMPTPLPFSMVPILCDHHKQWHNKTYLPSRISENREANHHKIEVVFSMNNMKQLQKNSHN